jgi:hypothetical protein
MLIDLVSDSEDSTVDDEIEQSNRGVLDASKQEMLCYMALLSSGGSGSIPSTYTLQQALNVSSVSDWILKELKSSTISTSDLNGSSETESEETAPSKKRKTRPELTDENPGYAC